MGLASVGNKILLFSITFKMKIMRLFIFLLILGFLFFNRTNAAHVVGGNFQIEQTGANSFNISLSVFRDCSAGNFRFEYTNEMQIGLFDKSTNTLMQTLIPDTIAISPIDLSDPCYTPTICVEEGRYTFDNVTIPDNPNGYYLVWERCCRNPSLLNLNDPTNTGLVNYAEIPDPATLNMNSSPVFGPYPSNGFLCVNNNKQIDFSAVDPDGDNLVYSLITPSKGNTGNALAGNPPTLFNSTTTPAGPQPGPYTPATWAAGYSLVNPFGAGGSLTIDANTGLINATVSNTGLFAFAVLVEEFRGGIKIGEVIREMQFEGVNCATNDLPTYPNFPDTLFVNYKSNICSDFVANDPNGNDSIVLQVNSDAYSLGANTLLPTPIQLSPDTLYEFSYFNISTGQQETQTGEVWNPSPNNFYGFGMVGAQFCWQPNTCEVFEKDFYSINLNALSFGCDGTDTVSKEVIVKVIAGQFSSYSPNVFSPNGDGKNDFFYLGGSYNECNDVVSVKIFDRWGKVVFEDDNPQFRWDGKSNGRDVPEGTYYVILQGTFGDKDVTDQFPLSVFR